MNFPFEVLRILQDCRENASLKQNSEKKEIELDAKFVLLISIRMHIFKPILVGTL